MPWKEKTVEERRMEFVVEALSSEKSMSQLCRDYCIDRKTGYKWLERAKNGESMSDKSHRPKSHPNQTAPETVELIINTRIKHPAWGARKLKRYLENQGHNGLPAQSTICEILKRNGLVLPEESVARIPYKRFEKEHPNDMWQMDFKGDFGLLNTQRCHPLTILDDCSRFSIALEAKTNQQRVGVFTSLEQLFCEYGLPASILCDNGPPWGDSKAGGITQFDVWMMKLGVLPIHSRPRHPQTLGKDERFHRTLNEEVLKREIFIGIPEVQYRFDQWRYEYNFERPHNALGLDTPSKRYRPSKRKMPSQITEPDYDSGKNLRKVNSNGYISIHAHRYYLSEALIGTMLEVKPRSDTEVSLHYGNFRLAIIDTDERLFTSRRIYRDSPKN